LGTDPGLTGAALSQNTIPNGTASTVPLSVRIREIENAESASYRPQVYMIAAMRAATCFIQLGGSQLLAGYLD
jgi:hypothetical protein